MNPPYYPDPRYNQYSSPPPPRNSQLPRSNSIAVMNGRYMNHPPMPIPMSPASQYIPSPHQRQMSPMFSPPSRVSISPVPSRIPPHAQVSPSRSQLPRQLSRASSSRAFFPEPEPIEPPPVNPDDEALRIGILVSAQEADYGTNMFKDSRPADEPEIAMLMGQGLTRNDALLMIFERRHKNKPRLPPPSPSNAPTDSEREAEQQAIELAIRLSLEESSPSYESTQFPFTSTPVQPTPQVQPLKSALRSTSSFSGVNSIPSRSPLNHGSSQSYSPSQLNHGSSQSYSPSQLNHGSSQSYSPSQGHNRSNNHFSPQQRSPMRQTQSFSNVGHNSNSNWDSRYEKPSRGIAALTSHSGDSTEYSNETPQDEKPPANITKQRSFRESDQRVGNNERNYQNPPQFRNENYQNPTHSRNNNFQDPHSDNYLNPSPPHNNSYQNPPQRSSNSPVRSRSFVENNDKYKPPVIRDEIESEDGISQLTSNSGFSAGYHINSSQNSQQLPPAGAKQTNSTLNSPPNYSTRGNAPPAYTAKSNAVRRASSHSSSRTSPKGSPTDKRKEVGKFSNQDRGLFRVDSMGSVGSSNSNSGINEEKNVVSASAESLSFDQEDRPFRPKRLPPSNEGSASTAAKISLVQSYQQQQQQSQSQIRSPPKPHNYEPPKSRTQRQQVRYDEDDNDDNKPNPASIRTLQSMGFKEEDAIRALIACNHKVDRAANFLLAS